MIRHAIICQQSFVPHAPLEMTDSTQAFFTDSEVTALHLPLSIYLPAFENIGSCLLPKSLRIKYTYKNYNFTRCFVWM
jgi:hypothetical protein